MSEKLKTCPFCGGRAEMGRNFGRIGIACTQCNVNLRSEEICKESGYDCLITAWNKREPDGLVAGLVGALKKILIQEEAMCDALAELAEDGSKVEQKWKKKDTYNIRIATQALAEWKAVGK